MPEINYIVQWAKSTNALKKQAWFDDKYMTPSPLCEALDLLAAISKRFKIPSARLDPVDDDADLLPILYKR